MLTITYFYYPADYTEFLPREVVDLFSYPLKAVHWNPIYKNPHPDRPSTTTLISLTTVDEKDENGLSR